MNTNREPIQRQQRNNFINSTIYNTITINDLPIYNTINNNHLSFYNTLNISITTHIINTDRINDDQPNVPINRVKKPVTIIKTTNNQICECCICFEEKKMVKLNCGHLFCEACVNKINVCALCRSNIINIEI